MEATLAPAQSQNQVDRLGVRSAADDARRVFEAHRQGLDSRRQRDLVSEKLLLHIDGAGDNQWADILYGQRVAIPRLLNEYRKTENLLRPIVDNAVANHTSIPMRFLAESQRDRASREKALIDTLWANHLAETQDFDALFAEALYMAMASGFCPVHAYWREDTGSDWYEPVEYAGAGGQEQSPFAPQRGFIDCWVGNPFDTVFNPSANWKSVQWMSYGRVLNADLVRRAFAHIPEAASLTGSSRLPSASTYQRIVRDWTMAGLDAHGSNALTGGRNSDEELIALVCRETAPGVLTDYPEGRLQIIALNGSPDTRKRDGGGRSVLLHDSPLPGGDYSWSNVYSHHAFGDVHGTPWVESLDKLQVDLNLALSKRWEVVNRYADAPILATGEMVDDEMEMGGYNILQFSGAQTTPQQMQLPVALVQALQAEAEEKRTALYTKGGYQAASRGESKSGDAASKVQFLQQADDTIHRPVNQRFRRGACDFMGKCWRLMKSYGDVPWIVDVTGDEFAHLADTYIDRTKLSDDPPSFKLVSAFGSSPEQRAQEMLQLLGTTGADGGIVLSTAEFRKNYPFQTLFDDDSDPAAMQRRRPRVVNARIRKIAEDYLRQVGFDVDQAREQAGQQTQMQVQQGVLPPEWAEQMAEQVVQQQVEQHAGAVFQRVEMLFPRRRSDDLDAHIAALTEIVQDETEDVVTRRAAELRLDMYYQWQQMMAMQAAPMVDENGEPVEQEQPQGQQDPGDIGSFGTTPDGALEQQGVMAAFHGSSPMAGAM